MSEPIAYFLTWTTYGTWLPGDERGWVKRGEGLQSPEPVLHSSVGSKMREPSCILDRNQRELVEKTINDHCEVRDWTLHAVSCRSNHVHVVVSANLDPEAVRNQFKVWCTRRLKEQQLSNGLETDRRKWWTEGGSQRYINNEDSLEAAIVYVMEAQDRKDRDNSE